MPAGQHLALYSTTIQLEVAANGAATFTQHAHNAPDPDTPEPPTDIFQLEGESFFFKQDDLEAEYEAMLQAKGDNPIDEDAPPYLPHAARVTGLG